MQPGQNNNPNKSVVAGAPVGARPVGGVGTTGGESADAGPTFGNGVSIVGRKSSNAGWILAIILLLLVAAGGVGFGVWAYMDGDNAKNNLNAQIDVLQQQNSELQEQINNNSGSNIGGDGGDVDTADYIYVGEWGLKIKIPEGLNNVGYVFRQWKDGIGANSIYVVGTTSEELLDFANLDANYAPLGTVTRILVGSFDGAEYDADFMDNPRDCGIGSVLVFSDGEYNYCYAHPQSVYSTDELEKGIEVESVDLIETMLKDEKNYSKI